MKSSRRSKKPVILVSNDDGVEAEGIVALAKVLKKLGRVVVVAPDQQRSAAGHSITLHRPLRVNRLAADVYAVDGTPTDCIMLGVHKILKKRPDLVVSGVNHGANLGEDIHYSGTVSAAIEGGILGIPSIAVSLVSNSHYDFSYAARFALKVAKKVLKEGLPDGVILNVNIPNITSCKINGYSVTTQGKRSYGGIIIEKIDPRGKKYYWIGGSEANYENIPDTDCGVIKSRRISITPLRVDLTDRDFFNNLKNWKFE